MGWMNLKVQGLRCPWETSWSPIIGTDGTFLFYTHCAFLSWPVHAKLKTGTSTLCTAFARMFDCTRWHWVAAIVVLAVVVLGEEPVSCTDAAGDPRTGGACYHTTHSLVSALDAQDTSFPDPEIKEWHFHVYWFQSRKESKAAAMRIRSELIEQVKLKKFVVVLNGIDRSILPNVNTSAIPLVNNAPIGPHPVGSYEVWCPKESLPEVLSFFMLRRGELSILLHPLTPHPVEDHAGRQMWLGPSFRLDLTVLCEHCPEDAPQYRELGLGYSARR